MFNSIGVEWKRVLLVFHFNGERHLVARHRRVVVSFAPARLMKSYLARSQSECGDGEQFLKHAVFMRFEPSTVVFGKCFIRNELSEHSQIPFKSAANGWAHPLRDGGIDGEPKNRSE